MLVTGAGPIGALVVLICNAVGASKIFVSEPNANRRKHIENLGVATAVLDPKSVNVVEFIRENTEEGVGVDAAIECSGFEARSTPASRPCVITAPLCRPACM